MKKLLLVLFLVPACVAQTTQPVLCKQLTTATGVESWLPCPSVSGGTQGPQGDPGPAGPKGDQGDPGLPGAQGVQGVPGAQGLQGLPGQNGVDGIGGLQGPAGTPGKNGTNGAQGPQGVPGAAFTWSNENLPYAATVTISVAKLTSRIALSGDMALSIAAGQDGQFKCINFVHDSTTTQYAVTQPKNMVGLMPVGFKRNQQCFVYYVVDGLWEAAGPGVIGQ